VTSTSELPRRAEQAILGSVLARGSMPAGSLTAGDFADPLHQAIYAALATEPASRGPFTRLRDWLASLLSRQARDARSYLEELPALCPEPRHGDSYAAMVTEAAAQRTAARARQAGLDAHRARPQAVPVSAEPVEPDNNTRHAVSRQGSLASGTPRRGTGPERKLTAAEDYLTTPMAATRPKTPWAIGSQEADLVLSGLDPQVARLARALRPAVRSAARQAAETAADGLPGVAPAAATAIQAQTDGNRLQELLLTTLLRHPGEASVIVGTLPEAAFTAGPHRELWQMISQHVQGGKPFDPLILAWAASRQDGPQQPQAAEALTAMTLRLAEQEATPGTARILARALHADHICTTTLGTGWNEAPQRADAREGHLDAAQARQAEQAPDPAATAAGSPASQQAPAGPDNQGRRPQRTSARTRPPHSPSSSSAPVTARQRPGGQRPAASAGQQLQVPRPPEPGPAGPAPVQ
jgi:DnaB-like helicase N terminal domain